MTDSQQKGDKNSTQQIERKTLSDYYTIGEEIGRGSFSVVKKGKSKLTGREVAVKCVQKKYIKEKLMEREIKIMKKIQHPNVLPLIEVFQNKDYVFLILELVTGGELFDKIVEKGNYSEKDACFLVRQILEAVKYLHEHGVVHRDLKPENLLCASDYDTTMHIYVADFGLSRLFEDNELFTTYCGSPEYVAPEVLACGPYDSSVDVWSVGVITYILLTGFLPFYDKNHVKLFEKIQNVDYNWDDCPEVSPAAKHFIQHLLVKDPKQRFTAAQALNHPWVKGEGVSQLSLKASFRDLMKEYNKLRKNSREENLGQFIDQKKDH
jgi:calcium/calmodulin-dependent protein kinase I